MELENAQDDLMFEVHKIRSDKTEYDKKLLKRYFADVEQLVQDLGNKFEVCQKVVVEDLMVVKSGLLREIASDELEKNELVQLLGWVQSYGDPDVLGNSRLGISTAALLHEQLLLSRITVNQLYDRYIEITKKDIHD
uniref:Uncharacterized protein n=1 Tax=Panagrolaimus davidi TaxID=227884 RepID=A0A914P4K6_9BILA